MGVDRFFCCGKLASVTITYGAVDNTESKPGSKKDNCCRNEKQSLKIKDTHFNVSTLSLSHPIPVVIPHIAFLLPESVSKSAFTGATYYSNAPPGHTGVPIYNLNCTYRI